MKIVCEACQAKYSIADEKVRGKVFKIRCKKCSHVIVVRGSGDTGAAPSTEFASSPSSAPDLALDAGWHIVVEGEQVGPLSEGDIRARLARGEITPETYIWKEGLADWVKVGTLAEFRGQGEAEAGSPFAGGGADGDEAFAGASTMVSNSGPGDVFAPASARAAGGAGGGVPDLFGSPVAADAGGGRAAAASSYAGYDAPAADPFAPMGGAGNGAAAASMPGGMTGQRHENSVLFSLSNLEALAKPNTAPLPAARSPGAASPSTSTTTEGSGLIDIRAMANMTLGAAAAKGESKGPDLPAFSAPQFSPVAPVLLAPSHHGGMPRWAIMALLIGVGMLAIFLAVVAVKLLTAPPPAAPVVAAPPAAAPAPPAPGAAAKAPTPAEKAPPATPPPSATEDLPPREPSKAAGATADREGGTRTRAGGSGSRRSGSRAGGDGERAPGVVTPTPRAGGEAPAPAPKAKPKDDIEALLEQATGSKRSSGGGSAGASARRDEEEQPRERLPPLSREDVVKGMSGVAPRARDCYNQYKVPGLAMVKLTVAPSGRVSTATVTGKFAGTPSGTCVENAVKSAKFPASAGLTFDYPVNLR